MRYPFTQEEFHAAAQTWGANCGPSAMAFALQCKLDLVRTAIPDFEKKGYTSPTMMKQGLDSLRVDWVVFKPVDSSLFGAQPALVRVQWGGPWCAAGANPKWAYWHTHWIATWREHGLDLVFDCNTGVAKFEEWKREIIPLISAHVKRFDGTWFPTHIWRIVNVPIQAGVIVEGSEMLACVHKDGN